MPAHDAWAGLSEKNVCCIMKQDDINTSTGKHVCTYLCAMGHLPASTSPACK